MAYLLRFHTVLHADCVAVHERVPGGLHRLSLPRRTGTDFGQRAALRDRAALQHQRSGISGGAFGGLHLGQCAAFGEWRLSLFHLDYNTDLVCSLSAAAFPLTRTGTTSSRGRESAGCPSPAAGPSMTSARCSPKDPATE